MSFGFYDNTIDDDDEELSDEELSDPVIGRFENDPTGGERVPEEEEFYGPNNPERPPQNQDADNYVSNIHHTAFINTQGKRVLDGYVIDSPMNFNVNRQITMLFGSVRRAREIFDQIYNAPQDPQTGVKNIPPEVNVQPTGLPDDGDQSGLKAGSSEAEARKAFDKQAENKRSPARLAAIRSGSKLAVNITPNQSGIRTSPDEGAIADANSRIREQFSGGVASEIGEPPLVEPPSPSSLILNDPIYGGIVSGWNEKLAANNVKLSSLVPFAELYVVFDSDDYALSRDSNTFSGIQNRVSNVKFIGGKAQDSFGRDITLPPPIGVPETAWVAKIGSTASQTQPDYLDYTNNTSGGTVTSYKGQPGLSDVAVSRASSGAYNIKYDISITLPNPEILNEQYEYSKLLLLNSSFLLLHGWNIKDSDFSVDNYPPNLSPSNTTTEITVNGGNNGFWSASLIRLYNFTFEFDNVGHLVGKLRFLTNQGAFMSAVSTDMVSSPMLRELKKVPANILNRAQGRKEKDKQDFIFANGVPWSKSDFSDDEGEVANLATEMALREAYRQLNDNDLFRGGDALTQSYFSGSNIKIDGQEDTVYDFDRYLRIKEKIEDGVERAANAVRDIFTNWGTANDGARQPKIAKSQIPFDKTLEEYDVDQVDSRFMTFLLASETDKDLGDWTEVEGGESIGPFVRSVEINTGEKTFGQLIVVQFSGGDGTWSGNLFGSRDLREASTTTDKFDSFLYESGSDLRNYYYNCILLNVAIQDEELSFIPPDGYVVVEKDGIQTIVDSVEADGQELPLKETAQRYQSMPKGQLIDVVLKEVTPTFEGPPTPESMPDFGQDLQRRIRTRFNDTKNLNNPNLSDSSDVLDQEVKDTMRQSSILSVPTLVTAPENPAPAFVHLETNSQEARNSILLEIHIARVNNNEEAPFRISDIVIPNGYTITTENIYKFNQPSDSEGPANLGDGTNIRVTYPDEPDGLLIDPGAANYSVLRKVFVFAGGYSIVSDRTNRQQEFVDGQPRPILTRDANGNGDVFIPEIRTILNSSVTTDEQKALFNSLIASVGDHVGLSQIVTQRELGNTANVDVEIGGIKYDVIMRPTYFWLGSVLESLSETLNERVKFFYKPLPSRGGKSLTIPMPASAKSGELAEIEAQIFINNKEIVLAGGTPTSGSREDYLEGEQTAEQEEKAKDNFLDGAVAWKFNFSNYMQDIILDKVQTVERADDIDGILDRIGIKEEDIGGKTFENFIRELYDIDENRNAIALEAGDYSLRANYYFQILTPLYAPVGTAGPDDVLLLRPGVYSINGFTDTANGFRLVTDFIKGDNQIARNNNGQSFPTTNNFLRVPNQVAPADQRRVDNLKTATLALEEQKRALGFDSVYNSLEIKTTYEIPIDIGAIEQILTAEGGAPTHSMLKKILSAANQTMPQLILSMRPLSKDPSYIEVFVNAVNEDGIIQEVFTEIDTDNLVAEGADSVDQFRRSVERIGSGDYLKSNKVMVCNFGTLDSLVENFQMSSKVDANALATFRLPSVMGGVSMDISRIVAGNLESSGLLSDIVKIINDGPVGGKDTLKELQIVDAEGKVTESGINNLTSLLTNQDEPVIQKASQGFIEDLMSQDVKFYSKIMALQNEYFNGLSEATTNTTALEENQRFAGSRFYGNILNTYLRTVTMTIHGTANLNNFNYIYLKGLLSGVEGLYVISSVNESVTPTSFTTTIECKLVEYVENDASKNPLAYRGEGSFARLATVNRSLRLPANGNSDATLSPIDFEAIVTKIDKIDNPAGG